MARSTRSKTSQTADDAARGKTTLYSPGGEKYSTADPAEITRLKARGYSTQRPSSSSSSSSSSSTTSSRRRTRRTSMTSTTQAPGAGESSTSPDASS